MRLLAVVLATAAGPACAGQAPSGSVPAATVSELIELAGRDSDQRFTVVGRLVNAGANYFTDRRIVLIDTESEATIAVRPWLPLEAYPAPDPNAPQPPTMAGFLDRRVELTVSATRAPVKGVGIVPLLEVHAARVLDRPD